MSAKKAFFVIEKGDPYNNGDTVNLYAKDELLVGRSSQIHNPDIAFSSKCISREHALISNRDNLFYITDLTSKHGTFVNNQDIGHHNPHLLKPGDRISLAKEAVVIIFKQPLDIYPDETVDLTGAFAEGTEPAGVGLIVHPERREVILDGKDIQMIGKDIELLLVLYNHRKRAVNYAEIKQYVWPERMINPGDTPDVGNEEINALVYRLRRRLGEFGANIKAIPRYGYMLDLE